VYIGRNPRVWAESGGTGRPKFGNDFVMKGYNDAERERVVREYAAKLDLQLEDPGYRATFVRELAGKALVCHCAPAACHGHVIATRLAEIAREQKREAGQEQRPLREETAAAEATGGVAAAAYAGIGARDTPPA